MLKKIMDVFSENGLFFKSNERLRNGRNVAVIQLTGGNEKIDFKIRYGNLPAGELNLADFAEKFFAVVMAFDPDDVAVRIYTSRKKTKNPVTLLTAINDAKVAKHNMFLVGKTLLNMTEKKGK